jgi:hypothetical protein
MAPQGSAGLKVTHTPYSKQAVSLESAQQSIESKRCQASGRKKRFFQAIRKKNAAENAIFPGMPPSL